VDCESREQFGRWREEGWGEGELVEGRMLAIGRMLLRKKEWVGRKVKEMVIEEKEV
jgi:hypothetical protein